MITQQQASEIKRLGALYAAALCTAAYSQEYVDRQAEFHAYVDALVGEEGAPMLARALKQAVKELDHAAELIDLWGRRLPTEVQIKLELDADVSRPRRSAAALLALVTTMQEVR